MESSRRAVESYWRSRMIDEATSDKDKVTAVYKLEEICELLRSSPAGIVKEVSEFILKRLDHKSPIVKQKALRVIKYAVGKSGTEFRREMQRHSVAVRQLLHYKGHPDPLKGDALNKAVRETAQEALSAIFSTDDIKPTPTENGHRRMEGFGNTNFSMPSEEKKSFISEVVGLGSATIKQGLSTLSQAHSFKKNETGSYRGPTLQRSLTNQIDYQDRYEKMEYTAPGSEGSSGISRNMASGPWGQDSGFGRVEGTNGDSGAGHSQSKTREERLLETIVTSGGVRLQPTRDALQVFLGEAAKVDALALSYALESKLQSPLWQVRMKAICVLEAILRKKDDEQFLAIASYFNENIDVVVKCSESPQASLREKANKVLSLFGGGRPVAASEMSRMPEMTTPVQMPDLIDTGEPDDLLGAEESTKSQTDQNFTNQSTSSAPLIDDLFGDSFSSDVGTSELKTDDDPFSDVLFHTGENKEQGTNLFAGMTIGDNPADTFHVSKNLGADPFDVFGSNTELPPKQENHNNDVDNLMAGLSINENGSAKTQKASSSGTLPESVFSQLNTNPGSQALFDSVSAGIDSQKADVIPNSMFPMGAMPYAIPPGMMFNQSYPSQAINYAAMGGLLAQQQQFMAAMANFKPVGSLDSQHAGAGYLSGTDGGYVSPLPDIFNAKVPNQAANAMMNMPKKEETKAFDFISDHLAAARDPKRVL